MRVPAPSHGTEIPSPKLTNTAWLLTFPYYRNCTRSGRAHTVLPQYMEENDPGLPHHPHPAAVIVFILIRMFRVLEYERGISSASVTCAQSWFA